SADSSGDAPCVVAGEVAVVVASAGTKHVTSKAIATNASRLPRFTLSRVIAAHHTSLGRLRAVSCRRASLTLPCPDMLDKSFAKWWLSRVVPFRDVAPEKLAAEREAMAQQQEYNRNYAEFLNQAVLPAVDAIVKTLAANKIVHRVSSWG